MNYQDIVNANKEIKSMPIGEGKKAKDYVMVNERINAFRKICPEGSIVTEIVSLVDGMCIIKATVLDPEGRVIGTGHAYEKEGSSFINKTSYIENCETSAVGRALGMLGIGIDASFASYEEVANAQKQQAEMEEADSMATQWSKKRAMLKKYGIDVTDPEVDKWICEQANIKSQQVMKLTDVEWARLNKLYDRMIAKKEAENG